MHRLAALLTTFMLFMTLATSANQQSSVEDLQSRIANLEQEAKELKERAEQISENAQQYKNTNDVRYKEELNKSLQLTKRSDSLTQISSALRNAISQPTQNRLQKIETILIRAEKEVANTFVPIPIPRARPVARPQVRAGAPLTSLRPVARPPSKPVKKSNASPEDNSQKVLQYSLADIESQSDQEAQRKRNERKAQEQQEIDKQRQLQYSLADVESQADLHAQRSKRERETQETLEHERQRRIQESFGDSEYQFELQNQAALNPPQPIIDVNAEFERRKSETPEETRVRLLTEGSSQKRVSTLPQEVVTKAPTVQTQSPTLQPPPEVIVRPLPPIKEETPVTPIATGPKPANIDQNEDNTDGLVTTGPPAPSNIPIPTPKPEVVKFVTLECNTALNVRAEAKKDSQLLDDLSCKDRNNKASKIIILGEQDGHYQVFVNGTPGWINKEFTSEPQPIEGDNFNNTIANEPLAGTLTCHSRLRKRTGPSTRYKIVGKIPCKTNGSGTKVLVHGRHEDTGWYLVERQGQKSWVSDRYIDVEGPERLMLLTSNLIQGLDNIPDLGDVGINCDPGSPAMTRGDCIDINYDFYSKADSGKQMAASINQAKQRGTSAKKKRFLELFSPLAIEIQTLTGWPASVSLAQMALETNWGTSNVFKRLNNFGGHSCFSYNANGSRPLRNRNLQIAAARGDRGLPGYFVSSSGSPRVSSACTYRRPANEGGFYRDFKSVSDAAFLYADNVLQNRAYRNSQKHVKDAFAQGRKADVQTVVNGLRAYAADTRYRRSLMSTINANDLRKFDDLKSCQ